MLTSDLWAVPPASLCAKEIPSAQGWQGRSREPPILTMKLSKRSQCLPHCVRVAGPRGATPQNCEAEGPPGPPWMGSLGPGWQGVAQIPMGPWRPSEDPRGAPQIPGFTLRHLASFPRQSSKGETPCVWRGREDGLFRD